MFNPSREIFEMEFRQQELARKLENHDRVRAARPHRNGVGARLWAQVRYGWQVLSRIRKVNIAISIDVEEPCVDVAG